MTDPPYGANIDYDTYEDGKSALIELVNQFFPIIKSCCSLIALTPGNDNVGLYPSPDWILCWFYGAGTGKTTWGFSAWQPFLVWGKWPKLANGEGCHPDGFSLPMTPADSAERKTLDHACSKPLTSWAKFMERLTNKKTKSIFDPFLGSGTTLIAAEQLDRTCYGMEISPAYCDVIVERWEKLTGEKAKRQEAKK